MITKLTMVVIFNLKNSHLITFFLPTDVFQVNGQNQPVINLLVVNFHSQPREMLTPKPLIKVPSGFSFSMLVFFPFWNSLNLNVCQQYVFLSVLAATIRGFSRQTTCIKNREGFAVHSSTWSSGAKDEWRVSSWLAISTREKIRYLFTCVVTAILRAGNLCMTPQFMW